MLGRRKCQLGLEGKNKTGEERGRRVKGKGVNQVLETRSLRRTLSEKKERKRKRREEDLIKHKGRGERSQCLREERNTKGNEEKGRTIKR